MTKVMGISQHTENALPLPKTTTWGEEIKWMEQFVYLESVLSSTTDSLKDIKRRLVLTSLYFKSLRSFWENKHLPLKLKI